MFDAPSHTDYHTFSYFFCLVAHMLSSSVHGNFLFWEDLHVVHFDGVDLHICTRLIIEDTHLTTMTSARCSSSDRAKDIIGVNPVTLSWWCSLSTGLQDQKWMIFSLFFQLLSISHGGTIQLWTCHTLSCHSHFVLACRFSAWFYKLLFLPRAISKQHGQMQLW